ncbi:MAG: Tol-Pal system protein TolB [Alphaproteobacteria bacterium]|nr:Tol-Pal system protein TolB [Alphaproteobacteria bacterium]
MKLYRFLFLIFLFANSSNALTQIDITRSQISPMPLAMPEFIGDRSIGIKLRKIIINDLESTGLFRVINKDAYIETVNLDDTPTFASWRQINATSLIFCTVKKKKNSYSVSFKMWDVFTQEEILNKSDITLSKRNERSVAHIIADEIYSKLTGEQGYFNTKITYVSSMQGKAGKVLRRIASMDQDGHNHQYLTDNSLLVLTPRFSPSSENILYLSYEPKSQPKVRTINTKTKFSRVLGSFEGMSYAPRYIDKSSVLLSVVKNGVSNIHILNLDDMVQKQITYCSSICTSPSVSPDRKQIVFNSDMGGTRQLYVMDLDGKNIERISFNKGYYSSPLWSPRGDLIAFTKMLPGKGFFIGVMRPDGTGERLITRGWLVDGASWAPNGRVLMFEKEPGPKKGKKIYTIDITGNNTRVLRTPHEASDPSWSNSLG